MNYFDTSRIAASNSWIQNDKLTYGRAAWTKDKPQYQVGIYCKLHPKFKLVRENSAYNLVEINSIPARDNDI